MKKSLTMGITTIVITAFVIIVFSVSSFRNNLEENLTDDIYYKLSEISANNATSINKKIDDQFEVMQAFSMYLSDEDLHSEKVVKMMQTTVSNYGFLRCAITFPDGTYITHDNKMGGDTSQDDYVVKGFQGISMITGPRPAVVDPSVTVILLTKPIFKEDKIIGLLTCTYETQYLNRVFKMTDFKGKGYSYICDKDGNIITRPNIKTDANVGNNLLTYFSQDDENSPIAQDMIDNVKERKSGSCVIHVRGEQKYLDYQPLELKDWYVFSVTSSDVLDTQLNELLDAVYRHSITIILTFFVLILFVIIILTYVNNKSKKALQSMAYIDDVTKGPNKNLFEEKAKKLLKNTDNKYAYIIMNVNKFKVVNDIFGFEQGNNLLRYMEIRIKEVCKEDEAYARFNSDNFHLLLQFNDQQQLKNRLFDLSKQICRYEIDKSVSHALSIAIGVYIVEQTYDEVSSIGDKARMALSKIRGIHETTINFYDTEIIQRLLKEQEIENTMKDGLKNHELQLYLQPKVMINKNKPVMIGSEALVRWIRNGKMIMPNDFIPLFERNGFIKNLDFYMIESACKVLVDWQQRGLKCLPISINQARLTLFQPDYIETLLSILKQYKIDPCFIEIEITERMFFEDVERLVEIYQELHKNGFSVAMDDFGSGYSSLNMLQDIHVDVVKIDKNFFDESIDSDRGTIIVKNIVSMAKELKMDVVAEGIETQVQVDLCRELNCDCIQGFYFSKAVTVAEYEDLLLKY
ncbi:MAG: GGDEF domain-containing protein [Erysipelotrichaceae bacterium]